MNQRRWVPARAALVLVVALRSCCRSRWSTTCGVAGAIGDLVLVVVVAAGITGGADRGATYGFVAGLLFDLLVDTPFGLTALTYALVGYGVGVVGHGAPAHRRLVADGHGRGGRRWRRPSCTPSLGNLSASTTRSATCRPSPSPWRLVAAVLVRPR